MNICCQTAPFPTSRGCNNFSTSKPSNEQPRGTDAMLRKRRKDQMQWKETGRRGEEEPSPAATPWLLFSLLPQAKGTLQVMDFTQLCHLKLLTLNKCSLFVCFKLKNNTCLYCLSLLSQAWGLCQLFPCRNVRWNSSAIKWDLYSSTCTLWL